MNWRTVESIFVGACLLSVGALMLHRSWRSEHKTAPPPPAERPVPALRAPVTMTEPKEVPPRVVPAQASEALTAEIRTLCGMLQEKRMTIEKMVAHLGTMEEKCEPELTIDVRPRNPLFVRTSIGCPDKGKHPDDLDLYLAKPYVVSTAALRRAFGPLEYDPRQSIGDEPSFLFRLPPPPGGRLKCRVIADIHGDPEGEDEISDQVEAELKRAGLLTWGDAYYLELGRRLDGMVDRIRMEAE